MADFNVQPLNPNPAPVPQNSHSMSRNVLKWLIILAVGLFVVAALIFWFGSSSFTESGVDLKIDAPTQASVGDQIEYKVTYANSTKSALSNIHLTFTYPDNSIVIDQNGQPIANSSNTQTVNIQSLNSGQSGEQDFYAFLIGDTGNIKTAKAVMDFNAGNIQSSFEKTATLATTITTLPISLTLSAPPSVSPGQPVSYVLDYRNQSNNDISGLQVVFTYPDGFTPNRFSPAPSQGNNTWSLANLKQSGNGRITVSGTLNGNEGDSKNVSVALQRNINGAFVNYEQASTSTLLSSALLNVSIAANDDRNYISHAGDTMQYTVKYKNASSYTLTGLTLTVKLDGAMYDFSSMNPDGGFFDSNTQTISWNSAADPDFNNLAPNQSGSLTFTVKLKPNLVGTGSGSYFVHATATLSTDNVPSSLDVNTISSQDDIVTKLTSQPIFEQSMYYNDTSFGQTGPLPPTANTETDFTVHWKITNPGNALSSARLTATLPQGVIWKNAISVGAGQPQPTYNKNTSQVVWNLGTVPAGAGINSDAYELVFQIGVKPSTTQVGQPVVVLQSPSLSGADSFTQQNIVVSAKDLSTNDPVDKPGQGTVQ